MSIENLVSGAPTPEKTREHKEFPGFKLQLSAKVNNMVIDTEVRYKKIDVKPMFEIEGDLFKVGPNGWPVILGREETKYFEVGPDGTKTEIREGDVKKVQKMSDGTMQIIDNFDRIEEVKIDDTKNLDEIIFEGPISYGTVVPRYTVDRWNQTDTYAW